MSSDASGENLMVVVNDGGVYTKPSWANNFTVSATSNASSWTSIASDATGQFVTAAAFQEGLFLSIDYGLSFVVVESLDDRERDLPWIDITMDSSAQYMYAAVTFTGGQIYRSSDGGANWAPTAAPNSSWTSVATNGDGKYVAASSNEATLDTNAGIYISDDFGETWTESGAPINKGWFAVAMNDTGQFLAAVVFGEAIYTSGDFGVSWEECLTAPDSVDWRSISMSSNGDFIVAASSSDGIFLSFDRGANWEQSTASLDMVWRSVASDASGSQVIAAASAALSLSAPGGVFLLNTTASEPTSAPTRRPSRSPTFAPTPTSGIIIISDDTGGGSSDSGSAYNQNILAIVIPIFLLVSLSAYLLVRRYNIRRRFEAAAAGVEATAATITTVVGADQEESHGVGIDDDDQFYGGFYHVGGRRHGTGGAVSTAADARYGVVAVATATYAQPPAPLPAMATADALVVSLDTPTPATETVTAVETTTENGSSLSVPRSAPVTTEAHGGAYPPISSCATNVDSSYSVASVVTAAEFFNSSGRQALITSGTSVDRRAVVGEAGGSVELRQLPRTVPTATQSVNTVLPNSVNNNCDDNAADA